MSYRSQLPQISARMREAREAGLIAAAQVPMNKTSQRLRQGYRGGQYVTPNVALAVNRSEPFDVGGGVLAILYGTDVKYAMYWELGFWKWPAYYSAKLGRWVSVKGYRNQRTWYRTEIWVPIFYGSRDEMMAAYQRTFQRFMGGGATGQRAAASPRSPDSL